MATICHTLDGMSTWPIEMPPGQPLVGDVVWDDEDEFRVISRAWLRRELHVDVVQIVEEESDGPT